MTPDTVTRPATESKTTVRVPPGFSFERTVASHGWFDLPPFAWDPGAGVLTRTLNLAEGGPVVAHIRKKDALRITLRSHDRLSRAGIDEARRAIAHMLRLEDDLAGFYRMTDEVDTPDLRWAATARAGRLLRSPTVFEDLIRMICTTNCTWALTKVMVTALVTRLGETAPGGLRTFPSPASMARRPEAFYRDVVRAGYRGAALRGLARAVAGGRLDVEAWIDLERPTEVIRKEILSVHGAGPYVADNMLKLLGRYDGLGIDSWCRRKFSSMYHEGRPVSDRRIVKFYSRFGSYAGLALWCDITRDWFEGDQPMLTAPEKLTNADY